MSRVGRGARTSAVAVLMVCGCRGGMDAPLFRGGAGGGRGGGGPGGGRGGGPPPGNGGSCPPDVSSQTRFVNLAPPLGAPLDRQNGSPIPVAGAVPPAGWNFYHVDGAVCRDGSPAGFYVRVTTSRELLIYLERGGACSRAGWCVHKSG